MNKEDIPNTINQIRVMTVGNSNYESIDRLLDKITLQLKAKRQIHELILKELELIQIWIKKDLIKEDSNTR